MVSFTLAMAILISLATIPSREQAAHVTIESLLNQTLPPDRLFIQVCRHYHRLGSALPDGFLSAWRNHPRISFLVVPDEGPATKFLGASELTRNPDDILVFCDDDVAFFPTALSRLAAFLKHHPGTAVGFWGRILDPSLKFNRTSRVFDHRLPFLPNLSAQVDILMATGMIAMRGDVLPADLRARWQHDLERGPTESLRFTDDIFLNATLNRQRVKRFVVSHRYAVKRLVAPDAIWSINRHQPHNNLALEYFRSDFQPVSHGFASRLLFFILYAAMRVPLLWRWAKRAVRVTGQSFWPGPKIGCALREL